MMCITTNIFRVNSNELRIRDNLPLSLIQRRIKMYDELLKFCQPLINSRVMSEKETRSIASSVAISTMWTMINSLSPMRRGAAQSVFYLLHAVLSLPPGDSSSRFFTCRTMYTRATRSGVTRRTGATTNLFATSSRCISTL